MGATRKELLDLADFWESRGDSEEAARLRRSAAETEGETKKVEDLEDGERFSLDGKEWHTCAVVLFGNVAVYTSGMRGPDATTRRIDAARDLVVLTAGVE